MEILSVLQNSLAQVLYNYIRASFFYNETKGKNIFTITKYD